MRGFAAGMAALLSASLLFLLFGIIIPMLGIRAYYGTENEMDGPGIMVLFIPLGIAVICVAVGAALTKVFYQSWSPGPRSLSQK